MRRRGRIVFNLSAVGLLALSVLPAESAARPNTGRSGLRAGAAPDSLAAAQGSSPAKRWVRRYQGPGNGDDDALFVASSPDGTEVFVTGFSAGAGSGTFFGM